MAGARRLRHCREKEEKTNEKAKKRLSHEDQKENLGGQLTVRGRRPRRVANPH